VAVSFRLIKSWNNRKSCNRKTQVNGKSWSRRIQYLEDEEGRVKLKLEDGTEYREIIAGGGSANTIWDRFKAGQSIDDSVSILSATPPEFLKSRRIAGREKKS
jgi:hypothetical protein